MRRRKKKRKRQPSAGKGRDSRCFHDADEGLLVFMALIPCTDLLATGGSEEEEEEAEEEAHVGRQGTRFPPIGWRSMPEGGR